MFDVEHEDDAWDLGVLYDHDFNDGSAAELGVPDHLLEFFRAGCSDASALSAERIEQLACRWGIF